MAKEPRSFSLDSDLVEALSERDDLNASAAVNTFLREYLSGGRGAEAAIEVRISQLDEEISDLEKKLERKRRERDRLESRIEDKRSEREEVIEEFVSWIENDEFHGDLSPDNPAVMKHAGEAGMEPERFIDEVNSRL